MKELDEALLAEEDSEDWPNAWEPMTSQDFGLLAFTLAHQVVVLSVVVHLVRQRDWPPYVTKNVTLVSTNYRK